MFLVYLQFVLNGIFKAELNEFLTRQLAEDGYSGVEIRVTPTRTEIIIMATKTLNVLGEKGRRIRELTAVVQKRYTSICALSATQSSSDARNSIKLNVILCFSFICAHNLDSVLLQAPLNCTPRRWPHVVCAPSLKPNRCVTN